MENPYAVDPEQVTTGSYLDERDAALKAAESIQQERTQIRDQKAAELDDPREKEDWGFKALVKEGQSIVSGGLQDTASSLTTFPERTVDALTGEIAKDRKEQGYYRPDWDPFVDYENPIETKTWWGKLLRGVVHFGSMAAVIIPTAKFMAARAGIQIGGGLLANSFVRAAGVGAASDIISKESDGHNALGALRDHYGFIDTPLSTKETDHPVMMKFKNVVEGMGIGMVFDGAAMLLGKGKRSVLKQIETRNQSIKNQTVDAAVAEIREQSTEWSANKNASTADPWQGAHQSTVDPGDAFQQQRRIRKDWGAEDGQTGSVTTAAMRRNVVKTSGESEAMVESVLQGLMSSEKYKGIINSVKAGNQTMAQALGDVVQAYQRITLGRNAADMPAEEFLKEFLQNRPDIVEGVPEVLLSKYVVVGELLVGSLLHQLKATGIGGRELRSLADLTVKDGPAYQIADTMITALTEVKKAKLMTSDKFRKLGVGQSRKAYIKKNVTKEISDSKRAIFEMLKLAKDEPDNKLLDALFETFSAIDNVNGLEDFEAFARKVLLGGKLGTKGGDKTGALIRELEGVFTYSVLSGPKTPMRAIMGTSTATFLRPISTLFGATMRYPFNGDSATVRASLASVAGMIEAIPESFKIFRTKLETYWSGDITDIKTRFSEFSRGDNNWELMRAWVEDSGRANWGERAAFNIANIARRMNDSSFLTYSTKIMAATDDAFAYILGRAKMREKAMRRVLDIQGAGGKLPEITPQVMRQYQDDFYSEIFDGDGNILDKATEFARKEVTLTQDIDGFAKGLFDVFSANPWARPFFLFARTGVNGLNLTAKHTPGLNFLVKEFNDIAWATPDTISKLDPKYGITTVVELANAKALQTGRLAMGSGLIMMASWAYMNGNLSGNGPADRQTRRAWIDADYKPRHITIGGLQVGYDAMEPFNLILSTVADIGDVSQLLGEEWTERQLQKVALVVAQGFTSKSYLAGMTQFVDLFAGREGQAERIIASLMNNTVPMAGLRNELGKLFNPHMKEINSGIMQSLRNRNLITEYLPGEDIPTKYDLLDGKPIRDHDFLTRAFNAISPISLNLTQSPGRQLLFNSGYDLRIGTYYGPDGTNLTDHPEIRSKFQQAIGQQNLELKLNELAEDPRIIESIEIMNRDIRSGNRGDFEPGDYYHNRQIEYWFNQARNAAWGQIQGQPDIQRIKNEQAQAKAKRIRKTYETTNSTQSILNMQPK